MNKGENIIKKIFLFLIIAVQCQYGQAWFPLDVGNKYQFLKKSWMADDPQNKHWSYELFYIDVLSDSMIADYRYYKTSLFPDTWIRHDCRDSKTYIYWNSKDHLLMDYALSADSLFEHLDPLTKTVTQVQTIVDTVFFAGEERIMKGYRTFESAPSGYSDLYISPDIGFFNFYHQHLTESQDTTKVSYELLNANLVLNYFTEGHLPQIIYNPLTVSEDTIITLRLNVDHFYNHIFPAGATDTGLNYVDSVYVFSRYREAGSIIENDAVSCNNIPFTDEWSAEIDLDLNLLENGYIFEYNIKAIDKALVPVHVSLPDSGYFELVYSPSEINEITDRKIEFKLYQNFPNPFNPVTEISFTIATGEIVSIKIFDILGKEVSTLVNEYKSPGVYSVRFDAAGFASGIYFCQLQSGENAERIKLILVK